MYDFNDENDIAAFKERLQQTRKQKNFIQDDFAEALHFSSRSSVGNWESKKNNILPSLMDFGLICKFLDVDPNYLLGVQEFDSSDDHAISQVLGLSHTNVRQLKNNKDSAEFIDYLLSSTALDELLKRIKQIYYYGMISEAQETTFTETALRKIQKAFDVFYRNVFPLDMNAERFFEYIKKEFVWHPDDRSIDDYIHSVITENEYNNILFENPNFDTKPDTEKLEILLYDVAQTSYNYMMSKPIVELAEQEITRVLSCIISGYITVKFKNK